MDMLISFFKMLSDETRLRIIVLLYYGELCVCEICGITSISQPKVSKHLAKLRDMGFVKDERQEQFVFYSLNLEQKLFKDIVKNIVDNLECYPIIKQDINRLSKKQEFFKSCKKCNS